MAIEEVMVPSCINVGHFSFILTENSVLPVGNQMERPIPLEFFEGIPLEVFLFARFYWNIYWKITVPFALSP